MHLQAIARVCDMSPLWEAAGNRGVEPSLVLPHAQPARSPAAKATVSRGNSSSDLARALCVATAMMPLQRETYSRAEWTQAAALAARTCARSREKAAGSGSKLDSESHKAAARRARQALCCELKSEAGLGISARPSDGADAGGIDSELGLQGACCGRPVLQTLGRPGRQLARV